MLHSMESSPDAVVERLHTSSLCYLNDMSHYYLKERYLSVYKHRNFIYICIYCIQYYGTIDY